MELVIKLSAVSNLQFLCVCVQEWTLDTSVRRFSFVNTIRHNSYANISSELQNPISKLLNAV